MEPVLREVFRHNAWANQRVLDFLHTLSPGQLAARDVAIYGDILTTMHHLIEGEGFYWSLFSGRDAGIANPEDRAATVEELKAWAEEMARAWDELLAGDIDPDAMLQDNDGSTRRMKASVVLLQAIHHGNAHREQVSHVLTTLGLTAPDISGWAFARAMREATGA